MMLARFGLISAASGGLVVSQFTNVHAAVSDSDELAKVAPKKIRPSQLPIYGEPEQPEFEIVPEKETSFHQKVSTVRKWTWSYLDSVQEQSDVVKNKYETAKAHTIGALSHLQEDANALPRIAFVTVAGLGGVVAGYRGGRIKKTLYATIGIGAAASVCYPREAVEVGGMGIQTAKDFFKKTYQETFSTASKTKKPKKVVEPAETTKDVKDNSSVSASTASVSVNEDHGMSNPADKDMYTTRDG